MLNINGREVSVIAFCALHYSGDFFKEALMSVEPYVDKFHIAHSRKPSQGFGTDLECPDKEEDMRKTAELILGDKLIWDTYGAFDHEGQHRNERYRHSVGYSLLLTVDADEIMVGVPEALEYAWTHEERWYGIKGFLHMYKGVTHYCTDYFRPIRIENLTKDNRRENLECPMQVFHMSYAQRPEILEYKVKVSGHRDELKPNYLQEKWYKWSPELADQITHLHPTTDAVWEKAVLFEGELPNLLKPYKR